VQTRYGERPLHTFRLRDGVVDAGGVPEPIDPWFDLSAVGYLQLMEGLRPVSARRECDGTVQVTGTALDLATGRRVKTKIEFNSAFFPMALQYGSGPPYHFEVTVDPP